MFLEYTGILFFFVSGQTTFRSLYHALEQEKSNVRTTRAEPTEEEMLVVKDILCGLGSKFTPMNSGSLILMSNASGYQTETVKFRRIDLSFNCI